MCMRACVGCVGVFVCVRVWVCLCVYVCVGVCGCGWVGGCYSNVMKVVVSTFS